GIPLVLAFGTIGYAVASLAVQVTTIWLFRRAQERVAFRVLAPMMPPWLWATTIGLVVYGLATRRPPTSFTALVTYGLAAGAVYVAGIAALLPRDVQQLWWLVRGRA